MQRKVKVPMPPAMMPVDGFDVPVIESTERWTEVTLEDGSILRLKASVLSAVRIVGQFDPEGNPMYALKTNLQMVAAFAPDELKRGYNSPKAN